MTTEKQIQFVKDVLHDYLCDNLTDDEAAARIIESLNAVEQEYETWTFNPHEECVKTLPN